MKKLFSILMLSLLISSQLNVNVIAETTGDDEYSDKKMKARQRNAKIILTALTAITGTLVIALATSESIPSGEIIDNTCHLVQEYVLKHPFTGNITSFKFAEYLNKYTEHSVSQIPGQASEGVKRLTIHLMKSDRMQEVIVNCFLNLLPR